MSCASTALIVGGGLAGLSAAIALSRVGVACHVLEIAEEPLGASIAFSGRAAEALDELGVYDVLVADGRLFANDTSAASQFDAAGHLVSPGPKRPEWPGAKDTVGVYRPEMLRALETNARALGVSIRKPMTIDALVEDSAGIVATFNDGEQRRFDVVIGADGIGSRTRDLILPDAPKPAFTGQMSVRWMCPGPAIEPEGWYHSPLGRVGFYHLPHQGAIYVPAVLRYDDPRRLADEEVHALFTELLDSFTAPAMQELRRRLTPDQELIGRPYFWVLVPEPWYRGRTILIGDAAHATTSHLGMGGGMAVEDAAVLAQCIAGSASPAEAFAAFMARRYDRVRIVVEASVSLSKLEQGQIAPGSKMAMMSDVFHAIAQPY